MRFSMMIKNRLPFKGSRDRLIIKIAKISKADVAGVSDDNVVENFDFQKLARSDEITSNFDVCLGWGRIAARMIVTNDDC